MRRTAILVIPAFAILAAHGFASDAASEQKAPAPPKIAGPAKCEKTSPVLDHIFDTTKAAPIDYGNGRSEARFYGDAGLRVTVIHK